MSAFGIKNSSVISTESAFIVVERLLNFILSEISLKKITFPLNWKCKETVPRYRTLWVRNIYV